MEHPERTVTSFGVVCLVSALVGYLGGAGAGLIPLALIAGVVMIVFSTWLTWRRDQLLVWVSGVRFSDQLLLAFSAEALAKGRAVRVFRGEERLLRRGQLQPGGRGL
ncbi:MAG TPA: hypothetical protein VGN08_12765 [Solirubrobacteraceae bacterium]|jgi:uncharacterized membrane protein